MKKKMTLSGTVTPSKVFAVLILAVGVMALFEGAEAITHISILASAGLYGWRKHETRKIVESKNSIK